jgi:1,4-dihydroxy-2-naphthoyl-CoA hydrolase
VSIWTRPYSLEELNAGSDNTLIRHLGIRFSEIGDDFLCATMPVDERTRQPYGLLHGGASVVLAETLGSMGANMCVDRSKYMCVGQEVNANHVRPARRGSVIGTARPAHLGGRTQVWTIEVRNEAQELTCISRLTMAVVRTGTLGP